MTFYSSFSRFKDILSTFRHIKSALKQFVHIDTWGVTSFCGSLCKSLDVLFFLNEHIDCFKFQFVQINTWFCRRSQTKVVLPNQTAFLAVKMKACKWIIQYCAKVTGHLSVVYIMPPRSQTFLYHFETENLEVRWVFLFFCWKLNTDLWTIQA